MQFLFRSIFSAALAFLPAMSAAQDFPLRDALTNQLIVKFKSSNSARHAKGGPTRMEELSATAGLPLKLHRTMSGGASVLALEKAYGPDEIAGIAATVAAHPEVEFAVPNRKRFPAQLKPKDAHFSGMRNLATLNVPHAWELTTGDRGVVVAVIDTGILRHADLSGRVLPGYDFVSQVNDGNNDHDGRDSSAIDPGDWVSQEDVDNPATYFDASCLPYGLYESNSTWHGTAMAGIIAGTANNGVGITGINWKSPIVPVRVLGKCGGYDSDIIDGMRWAAGLVVPGAPANANPARILNMSLGAAGTCHAAYQSAIDEINRAGKIIVVSAGNSGMSYRQYTPASCTGVIPVAAHTLSDLIAVPIGLPRYSNYGSDSDTRLLAAPGETWTTSDSGTRAANNDSIYDYVYGTSGAAAQLSGVVSLMLSANPKLSREEVHEILYRTGRVLSKVGGGRIDAYRAVGMATGYRGSAVKLVALEIDAPATLAGIGKIELPAYATWSDGTRTRAYPAWRALKGNVSFTNAGIFSYGTYQGSARVTVEATLTLDGVTVVATREIELVPNATVKLTIDGPDQVDLSLVPSAVYRARQTTLDGKESVADVTWQASAGRIGRSGMLFLSNPGQVTVTAVQGAVTATKTVNVVRSSTATPTIEARCAVEDVAGMTPLALREMATGASASIVPLCHGMVLMLNTEAERLDLVNTRAGKIAYSWPLEGRPRDVVLDDAGQRAYIAFYDHPKVAQVDLRTGQAVYHELGGEVFQLLNGEQGEVFVLYSDAGQLALRTQVAVLGSSGILSSITLPDPAEALRYSRAKKILVAASWLGMKTYVYDPAQRSFSEGVRAGWTATHMSPISPDGSRIAIYGIEFETDNLVTERGDFRVSAGEYSPDGSLFAGINVHQLTPRIMLMDAASHIVRQSWQPDISMCPVGTTLTARMSPGGAYLYAYRLCESGGHTGLLYTVALAPNVRLVQGAIPTVTGAQADAVVESEAVTLTGFEGTAAISVQGGEYSVNGAAFTALPGQVSPGASVRVRLRTSAQLFSPKDATLQVGMLTATFTATTGSALPDNWWIRPCKDEFFSTAQSVQFAEVERTADMIALCNSRVLLANTKRNSIDLYDLRVRAVIKRWQLAVPPLRMRQVDGGAQLLISTNSSFVARLDLSSGVLAYTKVGGRVYEAVPGAPGQFLVLSDPRTSGSPHFWDPVVSLHDLASGAEAGRIALPGVSATRLEYLRSDGTILLGNGTPTRLTHVRIAPDFSSVATLGENGEKMPGADTTFVVSPDGSKLLYLGGNGPAVARAWSTQDIKKVAAEWITGLDPQAGAFSADGSRALFSNKPGLSDSNGMSLFDIAGRLQRSWVLQPCDAPWGTEAVALSPGDALALGLMECGSSQDTHHRLYWVPTSVPSNLPQITPIQFTPVTVAPGTWVESNAVTISGLGFSFLPIVPLSGQWVNFVGDVQVGRGFVIEGDTVRAYGQAPLQPGMSTTVKLLIGLQQFDFVITTGAALAGDSVPDPFAFYRLKRQALNAEIESNAIRVSGTDVASPISVSGGAYRINYGTYTTTPGLVQPGAMVQVRLQTPNTGNTTSSASLAIGGVSASFTVTTEAATSRHLTVKVLGNGTVAGAGGAIQCGHMCDSGMADGSKAQLLAQPASGYRFDGWRGACRGAAMCEASMDADRHVVAVFSPADAPEVPTGVAAHAVGFDQVSVNWQGRAASYIVLRHGRRVGIIGSVTTFDDTSLSEDSQYDYTIQACSAGGSCSAPSEAVHVVTPSASDASYTPQLTAGWNLVGNTLDMPLSPPELFATARAAIRAVYQWNATTGKWSYYSPSLNATENAAFAAAKGYEVLTLIRPGTSYWVHAHAAASLATQRGTSYRWTAEAIAALPAGWHMLADSRGLAPAAFNWDVTPNTAQRSLTSTPVDNFASLWAWDAPAAAWYIYTPTLEYFGLSIVRVYALSQGYRHFEDYSRRLRNGTGFWIHRGPAPKLTIPALKDLDRTTLAGKRSNYTIVPTATALEVWDTVGREAVRTFAANERLHFSDQSIAFDVDGAAGKVYRLYQAAFDRKPDIPGLSFWINMTDKGVQIADIAAAFVTSAEFTALYGAKPENGAVVSKLYQHVLHREPEQAGYLFWKEVLDKGLASPAAVLAAFAESDENKQQVRSAIAAGISYTSRDAPTVIAQPPGLPPSVE